MSVGAIINLALALMQFVNWLMAKIDRAQLKKEVRSELIAEQALILAQRVGQADKIKAEVAKWSDEQLDDFLSQP